ncbi:hypothetical protein COLO4_29561 [Corchorus olitorius]|uniref:Uncharacterized protein n=1 Tax=Corchorus olitorius TaxID=93759 RepID=A0A1R3HE30_9ROSI|nr:hypothetical protein COLO4_29561 [Corchorus olitorius]
MENIVKAKEQDSSHLEENISSFQQEVSPVSIKTKLSSGNTARVF